MSQTQYHMFARECSIRLSTTCLVTGLALETELYHVSNSILYVCQGVFYPAIYNMLGNWAPLHDRTVMDALHGSGKGEIRIKWGHV